MDRDSSGDHETSERFDTFSAPPVAPEPDWDTAAATEPFDEGGELDPREAAALLEQAGREARHRLDPQPPLLLLLGAIVFLLGYGAVWWSVRDQHPFVGPAGWAIGAIYAAVIVWAVAAGTVSRRANRGVGGRSRRQQGLQGIAFLAGLIAVYVFQGALHHAGASDAIVYGIYPAVAPLIYIGGATAISGATREESRWLGLGLALVAIGSGGAFAGPRTAWLVAGVGLCVVILAAAAIPLLRRRLPTASR